MDEQINRYLILDSRDEPLGRGQLKSRPEEENWQVLVLDGKIAEVMEHEEIQLVPLLDSCLPVRGRILRGRYDNIVVKRIKTLDIEKRQNLRMPTHFTSFLYPVGGKWKGRRGIRAKDLSCGGIAFFCREELAVGEELEIVIPITSQPVLLRGEVLRIRPDEREGMCMYAAKFVDTCNDEEMLVREAVFNVQLSRRSRAGRRT